MSHSVWRIRAPASSAEHARQQHIADITVLALLVFRPVPLGRVLWIGMMGFLVVDSISFPGSSAY